MDPRLKLEELKQAIRDLKEIRKECKRSILELRHEYRRLYREVYPVQASIKDLADAYGRAKKPFFGGAVSPKYHCQHEIKRKDEK